MTDTKAEAAPALPSELSIYTAADTCAAWRSWLASLSAPGADAPPIDASAVDVVDGAGVQLLLALARSLRERGLALHLAAPSAALREACEALGASVLLVAEETA